MEVGELIKELQKMPRDAEVVYLSNPDYISVDLVEYNNNLNRVELD